MAQIEIPLRNAEVPAVITSRLMEVRRRDSRLRFAAGVADALTLFLTALFLALVFDWVFTLFSTSVRTTLTYFALGTGVVGLVGLAFWPQLKRRSLTDVAGEVDRSVPDLEERWQTVARIYASPQPEAMAGSRVLLDRVVAESVAREHLVNARQVVPRQKLRRHQWFLAAAIAANLVLFLIDAPHAWTLVRRFCSPTAPITLTNIAAIPGDLTVARGEPVHLEAQLAGRPRSQATFFLRNSTGAISTVALVPRIDDRARFAYAIESAEEPFAYRFRSGDGETGWNTVSISERPRLTSVELRLTPPAYTRLPLIDKPELPTNIRAVEGSQLEIVFGVDQPLEHFDLQLGPTRDGSTSRSGGATPQSDSAIRLQPASDNGNRFVFRTRLEKTIRLTPRFVSRNGLPNVHPPSCQVIVYPDRPPEVTIVTPDKEISLKPDDRVTVEILAHDDFGVARAELIAFVGDKPDLAHATVIPPEPIGSAGKVSTKKSEVGPPNKNSEKDRQPDAKTNGPEPAVGADGNAKAVETTLPTASQSNELPSNLKQQTAIKGQLGSSTQRGDVAKASTEAANSSNGAPMSSDRAKDAGSAQNGGPQASSETGQSAASKSDPANSDSGNSDAAKADPAKSKGDQSAAGNSTADKSAAAKSTAGQSADGKSQAGQSDSAKQDSAESNAGKSKPDSSNADKSAGAKKTGSDRPSATASKTPSEPPKTIVMPIPLASQTGDRKVRAKIQLDLSQFKLKQGQELKYMVRVYDSRDVASKEQTYADRANSVTRDSAPLNEAKAELDTAQPEGLVKQDAPWKNLPNSKSAAAKGGSGRPDAKNKSQSRQAGAQKPDRPDAAQVAMNLPNPAGELKRRESKAGDSPTPKPGESKDATGQNANGSRQDKNSGSKDGSSSGGQQQKQKPNDQKDQSSGASPPQDNMTRRKLDIDSSATASSTMKIHIDQFAGSFEGQQRNKLEMAIDPVIKELDAVLGKAIAELHPISESSDAAKPAAQDAKQAEHFKKSVRAADTHAAHAQTLVADLVKKSDGTPYAFIGLKLVDITELHISPSRIELKGAKPEAADKLRHVLQAEFHLTRAREMLTNLTRSYEDAKRNVRMAEEMQKIKTMYQVFVEDAMAMLNNSRGSLNPRNRKMAELELDEEFLKTYTEMQKRWQQTLADLAKVLAKDPRLLARYMSLSRRNVDTLRDQLTILNQRQQELLAVVDQLNNDPAAKAPEAASPPVQAPVKALSAPPDQPATAAGKKDANPAPHAKLQQKTLSNSAPKEAVPAKANGPASAKASEAAAVPATSAETAEAKATPGVIAVRAGLYRDLGEITTDAVAVQEDLGTWLPRTMKDDDKRIAPLRDMASQLSTIALQAATAAAGKGGTAAAAKKIDQLADQLNGLETALTKFGEGGEPQLVQHVNRRLAKVRKLKQLTAVWNQKQAQLTQGNPHRALELDQHRLSEDTLTFVGKLENVGAELQGFPDDLQPVIQGMVDELKDVMRYDVLVDQMSGELGLRNRDLPNAIDHEKKAIQGFARAEERFTKLIDRVIEEQDKVPPEVPDLENNQFPTLEDLLAQLEAENDLAELLGIPDRPTNLQTLQDWLGHNDGNGMGSSGGRNRGFANALNAAARLRQQLAERAQREALRALRKKAEEVARPKTNPATAGRASRWNTLGSRLEDAVRQGRGNTPPRQYRRAIERYFELISGSSEPVEPATPAGPDKTKPTPPAGEMNKAN